MSLLKPVRITATTLPDAWFQALHRLITQGRRFTVQRGSYAGQDRIELDWVELHILRPWHRDVEGLPLVPEMPEGSTLPPPVSKEYLYNYVPYLLTPTIKPDEQYTYGNRLTCVDVVNQHEQCSYGSRIGNVNVFDKYGYNAAERVEQIDQIERVITTYRAYGHRNNQMVLQIAQPSDLCLTDPPCLRHIDTRVQDDYLHLFPYFRSWDLWGGLPANLAAISYLQEYMATELCVKQGEMICTSKGLHIYGYAEHIAKLRLLTN